VLPHGWNFLVIHRFVVLPNPLLSHHMLLRATTVCLSQYTSHCILVLPTSIRQRCMQVGPVLRGVQGLQG
jgi:hypothetical protein